MMKLHDYTEVELEQVYQVLQKWTEYWLVYRDFDRDGIPEYPMGMDCGWAVLKDGEIQSAGTVREF